MALKPVYSLAVGGSHTVEVSQEGLRAILGQVEAELHRSEVYRQALTGLEMMVGETADGAQKLVKAVSREAIRLALRQVVRQCKAAAKAQVMKSASEIEASPMPIVAEPLSTTENPSIEETKVEAPSTSDAELSPSGAMEAVFAEKKLGQYKSFSSAKNNRKLTKAEIAAQAIALKREERLLEIGQELQQARQSRSMTIQQLHSLTCVPTHQIVALEAGQMEQLPEDIYIRGFIHRIGKAVGLDGVAIAKSLPAPDPNLAVIPSWYRHKDDENVYLRPMHLYLGYVALMAGAVGGLSLLSQQSAQDAAFVPVVPEPSPSSVSQSPENTGPLNIPGLSSRQTNAVAGPDISPPEAF